MIKRDGKAIVSARSKFAESARNTLQDCKNGEYCAPNGDIIVISKELDAALKSTVYHDPKDDLNAPFTNRIKPVLEVTNETTTVAAQRLLESGKTDIVALNFASARNPGGGFLAGALAQEEDLCRASGLYPCLKSKPLYYNANILCDDCYYTDGIIYSPNVPFFKDDYGFYLQKPYPLSIITSPAPNLHGVKDVDETVLLGKLANRAERILEVAFKYGHKNVILGAWGCGAFGNNPAMVAGVFLAALEWIPAFEHVTFAVYDTRPEKVLFTTFKEMIESNESNS